MSSFLSNKYLKYRNAQAAPAAPAAPATIETDTLCVACGYNLRGLKVGRRCPECGGLTERGGVGADLMLAGDADVRGRMAIGLALITVSLLVVGITRVAVWFLTIFTQNADIFAPYNVGCAVVSLLWMVGVILIMQREVSVRDEWMRRLRWPVLLSQPLWLVMWACWFGYLWVGGWSGGHPMAQPLAGLSMLASALAALGAWACGFVLMRLAMAAELDDGGQRIHVALWMLPLPAVVLALAPSTLFLPVLILIIPMVLLWGWFLVQWARGTWAMQRHVSWSLAMAVQNASRDERVRATRRELEAEVNAQIRATTPKTNQPEPRAKPRTAPGSGNDGDVPLA